MTIRSHIGLGLTTLSLCAGIAFTTQATALADPSTVQPMGGNGKCYTNWHTNKSVNMWCDGKGPERYGVSVVCTSGSKTYQYNSSGHPWFGDRRGATVTCKKGNVTTWWGYPAN